MSVRVPVSDSIIGGGQTSFTPVRPRIGYVVPGFCADENDWCIPVLRNFVKEMAQYADVVIYTPHYPYRRSTYRAFGATVHCFTTGPMRRGVSRLLLWREVWRRIAHDHRGARFDLIHAFWANESGFLATQAASRLGLRSIVSIGGGELARQTEEGYGSQLSQINRRLVARSFQNTSLITAGSPWLAEQVPERYRGKLVTLPLGVDTTMFRRHEPRRGMRILTAQAMIAVKNYPTLLRAFARAAAYLPELTLTIAGDGPERGALVRLADALDITNRVTFLGLVPHERMPELYRSHDLLLHSSLYESQGMVILEALATGMPVISSHVGIAAHLPAELVPTVAPRDHEGMADRIVASLTEGSHAASAHRNGPPLIERAFSLRHITDRFIDLYAQLMIRSASR